MSLYKGNQFIAGTPDLSEYAKTSEVTSSINNINNTISNKANTNLGNVSSNIDFVVESYVNGANWYRKYKSGWIEQGGTVIGTGDINVTFLKPFANTNYTIINTYMDSNSTDPINVKNVSAWNRTSTSFYLRTSGNSGVNKAWFACGQGA
jgi:hypothetical protein